MDPANIAPFVTFLGTDAAREITGQDLIVYGGIVAHVRMPHLSDMIVKDGGGPWPNSPTSTARCSRRSHPAPTRARAGTRGCPSSSATA